jgi:hypothetical protein
MNELEPIFFKSLSVSTPTEVNRIKNMSKGNHSNALKRWGHSSCVYDNYLYVFGGEIKSSQGNLSNALIKICLEDLENNYWNKITPREMAVQITDRDSHSAVVLKNFWYILFGHFNGNSINQILVFNFIDQTLSSFEYAGAVVNREAHASCLVGDNFIISIGGHTTKNNKNIDPYKSLPINVTDLENRTSTDVAEACIKGWEFYKSRKEHSMVEYNKDLYVFGGHALYKKSKSPEEEIFTDMLKVKIDVCEGNQNLGNYFENLGFFHLNQRYSMRIVIEKVKYEGIQLALHSHTCNILKNGLMVFIGGETYDYSKGTDFVIYNKNFYCYSFNKNFMFEITSLVSAIPKRISHSSTNYGNSILVFGGINENKDFLNDIVFANFEFHNSEEQSSEIKKVCMVCHKSLNEAKLRITYAMNSKTHEGTSAYATKNFAQSHEFGSTPDSEHAMDNQGPEISSFNQKEDSRIITEEINSNHVIGKEIDSLGTNIQKFLKKIDLLSFSVSDEIVAFINIINFFKGLSIDIEFTESKITFEVNLLKRSNSFKSEIFFADNDYPDDFELRKLIAFASLKYLGDSSEFKIEDANVNVSTGKHSKLPGKNSTLCLSATKAESKEKSILTLEILIFIMENFYLCDVNCNAVTINGHLVRFNFLGHKVSLLPFSDDHFSDYYFEKVSEKNFALLYQDNTLTKFFLLVSHCFAIFKVKNGEGDRYNQKYSTRFENKVINLLMQMHGA